MVFHFHLCSGIWNVPYIGSAYLIKNEIFAKISYKDAEIDAEMTMCKNLREQVYKKLPKQKIILISID